MLERVKVRQEIHTSKLLPTKDEGCSAVGGVFDHIHACSTKRIFTRQCHF